MYHLDSDAEDSLEVELAAALLKKILERLSEQIHNHHVVGLVVFSLLVTNKVQVRNTGYINSVIFIDLNKRLTLSSELVNELGLPVEHNVLLVLNGFFLYTILIVNIHICI
jgi:hypothetical protein